MIGLIQEIDRWSTLGLGGKSRQVTRHLILGGGAAHLVCRAVITPRTAAATISSDLQFLFLFQPTGGAIATAAATIGNVAVQRTRVTLGTFPTGRTARSNGFTNLRRGGIHTNTSGGIPNGPIARASAQIAIEMLFHVLDLGFVGQQRIDRHDDARSAEAALRTVHIDHGRLQGVKTTSHRPNALDGRDVGGIGGQHRHEAGIDGIVEDFLLGRVPSGDHDGAGAASALGTSQLGTGQAEDVPQVGKQSLGRSGLCR